MKPHALKFYACLMAVAISFVVTPNAQAQLALNLNLGGPEASETADSVEQMQTLLELHVEEIGTAVNLDQKQASQLKLTAKVVAKKVFGERQGRFLAPQGQTQSDSSDEESFSDQDEEANTKEAAKNPLKRMQGGVMVSEALNHKTWNAAVDSILTESQQTSLEEYRTKRKQKLRDVVVQYRTWEFVKRLRLSDDQIESVAKIVDRIEGDDLVNKLGKGGGIVVVRGGIKQPKSVTADDLKEVLSEAQLKAFKNNRSGGGSPAMNWQGAFKNALADRTLKARGVELDSDAVRPTVKSVTADSQFEKIGVEVGDIIDEVNRKPVDTLVQINRSLRSRNTVVLKVVRGGKSITLESSN